jgi:hypothetical protein
MNVIVAVGCPTTLEEDPKDTLLLVNLCARESTSIGRNVLKYIKYMGEEAQVRERYLRPNIAAALRCHA